MKISARQIRIMLILSDGLIKSAGTIAEEMKVSERTVRNEIGRLMDEHDDAFELLSFPGSGYQLVIKERERFHDLINKGMKDEAPEEKDRPAWLICEIAGDDHLTRMKAADRMFVSDSTLNAVLKQSKEILKEYNITIISRDSSLILKGNEEDIRTCLANLIHHSRIHRYLHAKDTGLQDYLRKQVIAVPLKHNVFLTKVQFYAFLKRISISTYRITQGHELPARHEEFPQGENETAIVNEITDRMEQAYRIQYSEPERYALVSQLSALALRIKTVGEWHRLAGDVTDKMLQSIKYDFKFDLGGDELLKEDLRELLIPVMMRSRFRIYIDHPHYQNLADSLPLAAAAVKTMTRDLRKRFPELPIQETESFILPVDAALRRAEIPYCLKLLYVGDPMGAEMYLQTLKEQLGRTFSEYRISEGQSAGDSHTVTIAGQEELHAEVFANVFRMDETAKILRQMKTEKRIAFFRRFCHENMHMEDAAVYDDWIPGVTVRLGNTNPAGFFLSACDEKINVSISFKDMAESDRIELLDALFKVLSDENSRAQLSGECTEQKLIEMLSA